VTLVGGDVDGRLRLSILDHTPVSSAFWHSTRLAELAEHVGYERYWVAEHHNMPWLASSSPAVLVAHVAARTTRLRVGSGGVMLPNYAPLAVAAYRGSFRPSAALEKPYAIVSVGVICAETDEIAERHHRAAHVGTVRNLSGIPGPLLPADEIETGPAGQWSLAQEQYVTEIFSSHFVGSPSTVKTGLRALAQRTGADEIMIATIMYGYPDRLRSYELIADVCLPRKLGASGGTRQRDRHRTLGQRRAQKQMSSEADAFFATVMAEFGPAPRVSLDWRSIKANSQGTGGITLCAQ